MGTSSRVNTRQSSPPSDREVLRLGAASLIVASLSAAYVWVGGASALPGMRTDSKSYVAGAEVGFQLKAGMLPLGYNLCFTGIERLDGQVWAPVEASRGPDDVWSMCTAEMLILASFDSARGILQLPDDLAAGEYRLVNQPELAGQRRRVVTGSFTVSDGPA